MATDIGVVEILSAPDEQQTTKVYDQAGKKAATRFVREMDRGIRRLVSNAAAAFAGARGRGAANIILAGVPSIGAIKGIGGRAAGAGAAAGAGGRAAGAGAAAVGAAAAATNPIGLIILAIVAATAAITLAVHALNKNTLAQVRRLSSVSPVLARVQAEGSVQELRQKVITARLFETSLASTARTLQSARGELFKVKLVLTAAKVAFGGMAANIKLGLSKALSFLIIDLPLGVRKLTNSIKIAVFNLLADVVDFLIPGQVGDSLAEGFRMQVRLLEAQNEMIKKISKILDDLQAKGAVGEMNDIMLHEVRKMAGLPVNPSNNPYLPDFDPYGPVSR